MGAILMMVECDLVSCRPTTSLDHAFFQGAEPAITPLLLPLNMAILMAMQRDNNGQDNARLGGSAIMLLSTRRQLCLYDQVLPARRLKGISDATDKHMRAPGYLDGCMADECSFQTKF